MLKTFSNDLGVYEFPTLRPGSYSLTVESPRLRNPDPALFFNTSAFVLNQLNHFGNAGRGVLTGLG